MRMGFAPTWLRQVSPPASQNHFNHWLCSGRLRELETTAAGKAQRYHTDLKLIYMLPIMPYSTRR